MQNKLFNETRPQKKSNFKKNAEKNVYIWTLEHENKKNNFYSQLFFLPLHFS